MWLIRAVPRKYQVSGAVIINGKKTKQNTPDVTRKKLF